jgi:hypothetical protein
VRQWEGIISRVNACCMSLRFGPGLLNFVRVFTCITYLYFSLFSVRKTSLLLLSVSVLHTTVGRSKWRSKSGKSPRKIPQKSQITLSRGLLTPKYWTLALLGSRERGKTPSGISPQSPQKDLFLTQKCKLGSCVFWPWKRIVTVPMAHQSQGNQFSWLK